jgi:hypothetical protein
LLCRLACHAMVFGNARAVAALWQRFVMQVGTAFKQCFAQSVLQGNM